MTDPRGRTWLVLGASSSIARAFARLVAEEGASVLLAGRDRDDLARSAADLTARHGGAAAVLEFDARDRASIARLVEHCRLTVPSGSLDVFVAFGAMPEQAAMEADPALAAMTIETNLTGAVELLLGLAPLLEAGKRGHVVVLGSVAGDRGRPRNYTYGAAKGALHLYLQGVRSRLVASTEGAVRIVTIRLGPVHTPMTVDHPKTPLFAQPADVAREIVALAASGPNDAYVPWFWRPIMGTVRALPERVFQRFGFLAGR
jgi:NAD(P)-dependent dehydrogenase (short-subunit alcohol dehydrogenase family)